jgi:hypothetical protein
MKVPQTLHTPCGRLRKSAVELTSLRDSTTTTRIIMLLTRGLRQWLYHGSSNSVLQYLPSTSSNVVDTSDVIFTCKVPGSHPIRSETSIIATPSSTCTLIQQKIKCPNSRPSASLRPHSLSDHPLTMPAMFLSHAQIRKHHKTHAPYPLPQSPVLPRHP